MDVMSWLERVSNEQFSLGHIKETDDSSELTRLIQKGSQDPYLGEFVLDKRKKDFVVFKVKDKPVGFAIPRRDSDGRYRTGAIFILPEERNKGYAKQYLKLYFAAKRGRAYIEPTNKNSQALFRSAGFVKTNKTVTMDGELLEEWLLG